ncbi:hypothetical protein KXR53_23430 [Inquilinus limosus]|uniref:hypothetical protein n=1 Tax=Inquilinus limosus TaxID=171674 RepID=UPI003F1638C0
MDDQCLTCGEDDRRDDVRTADLYGLDYVEVGEAQTDLTVTFLGKAPPKLERRNVRITGGRRITDVAVTGIRVVRQKDPTLDDYLEVTVDKPGDFSTYHLSLVKLDENGDQTDTPLDGFDPRYASVGFSFKAGCPSDLDCRTEPSCPPQIGPAPEINYLAKDYASFRQLILDRLALTMPDWRERHIPDIGIMLVELLAYVGDQLSYYQDAVATEAYLGTARRRISVRRHARLVDHLMHEGCNARAWVTIDSTVDLPAIPARDIYFSTGFPGAPGTGVLTPDDMAKARPGSTVIFEPLVADPDTPIDIVAAHSEIRFYSWGNRECWLPKGAISATLVDSWIKDKVKGKGKSKDQGNEAKDEEQGPPPAEPPGTHRALQLKAGDVLIFEEVIGPKTGNPADADPTRRQAVRLTKVTPAIDPLYHSYGDGYGQPVVEIEWCAEDALAFPLCLSARMPPPDCDVRDHISVARGNVILVHNSATHEENIGTVGALPPVPVCASDCEPAETRLVPRDFHPRLSQVPLTYSEPLPTCGCAGRMILQDPRRALPWVRLTGTSTPPEGADASSFVVDSAEWTVRHDLLASSPDDRHFVVENDDDGVAWIRFGNGREGQKPAAGTRFGARYGLGNGPAGNVGAETIRLIVFRQTLDAGGSLKVRNPLAAAGGTPPEPVQEVKMFAPHAFRTARERAITADDYAALAADDARRLAGRPQLLQGLLAAEYSPGPDDPPLRAEPDDPRSIVEEEPGEEMPPGTLSCTSPFRRLQGAKAALAWTGSWYEAEIAIDPLGSEVADAQTVGELGAYLDPFRRIGHDLRIGPARYVPVDLALEICVRPHVLRGDVQARLRDVFSDRALADGTLGFFHPDNLTFGTGILQSLIVAAAQAVTGVMEVQAVRLARYRLGRPAADGSIQELPPGGVLRLKPFEIAQLGSDPNAPEKGRLTLLMRGGR